MPNKKPSNRKTADNADSLLHQFVHPSLNSSPECRSGNLSWSTNEKTKTRTLYSYRMAIARRIIRRDGSTVFVAYDNANSSVTTAKHLTQATRAMSGNGTVFRCESIDYKSPYFHQDNIRAMLESIDSDIKKTMSARRNHRANTIVANVYRLCKYLLFWNVNVDQLTIYNNDIFNQKAKNICHRVLMLEDKILRISRSAFSDWLDYNVNPLADSHCRSALRAVLGLQFISFIHHCNGCNNRRDAARDNPPLYVFGRRNYTHPQWSNRNRYAPPAIQANSIEEWKTILATLQVWQAGGTTGRRINGGGLVHSVQALRLSLDRKRIETSWNVQIPIESCRRLWMRVTNAIDDMIESTATWHKIDDEGLHIPFSVDGIRSTDGTVDKFGAVIVIGCHRIPIGELVRIADQLTFNVKPFMRTFPDCQGRITSLIGSLIADQAEKAGVIQFDSVA